MYTHTATQLQATWLQNHRRVSAALASTLAALAFGEVAR
jgi:hypothetical protein